MSPFVVTLKLPAIAFAPSNGNANLRFRAFLLKMSDATVLLAAVEQGDSKAAAELLELVYD